MVNGPRKIRAEVRGSTKDGAGANIRNDGKHNETSKVKQANKTMFLNSYFFIKHHIILTPL